MLMKRIIVESGDNICNQIFFLDVSDETDFLIPPRMGELTFLILCLNSSRLARSRLHLSHFQHAEGWISMISMNEDERERGLDKTVKICLSLKVESALESDIKSLHCKLK